MSGTSFNHTKKTSALDQEESCTPGAASEERKESEDDRHDRQLRIPDAVSERRAIQDSYTNGTRQTIQLWDQFRVWDPGD